MIRVNSCHLVDKKDTCKSVRYVEKNIRVISWTKKNVKILAIRGNTPQN